MSDQPTEVTITRIVIAVDGSPQSMAAMQAGVDLASRLNAKVVGVYVEDLNLLRLAKLPIAREVSHYTATVRELIPDGMTRRLKAQASRVRRALAQLASRYGVDWRFKVLRGEISLRLVAEAEQADMLILGRSGWSQARRSGSTARAAIMQGARLTFVVQRRLEIDRPVCSVFDGSEASRKALGAAALLAERGGRVLTVAIVAEDEAQARDRQRQSAQQLAERGLRAGYRWLIGAGVEDLVAAAQAAGYVLVIPAEVGKLMSESMIQIVDRLESPVLVVR